MPRDPETGKTTVPPGRYLARMVLKSEKLKTDVVEVIRQGQRDGWRHDRIRDTIAATVLQPVARELEATWRREAEERGERLPTKRPFDREDLIKAAARVMRASPLFMRCG